MANTRSLAFTTGSYYVTFGSGRILSTLANASVSIYVKATGGHGGNGGTIYCERAPSGNDIWKLQTTGPSTNILSLTHRDTAGTLNQPAASTNMSLNTWYHVVMTKAGTTITFYINGVQDGSTGTLSGTDTYTNTGTVSSSGLDIADASSAYTGIVDELLLFNKALSSVEVASLYSTGTIPSNLIDSYHFEEGTGTSTADSTGTNTGTLTNALIWSTDTPTLPISAVNSGAFAVFF